MAEHGSATSLMAADTLARPVTPPRLVHHPSQVALQNQDGSSSSSSSGHGGSSRLEYCLAASTLASAAASLPTPPSPVSAGHLLATLALLSDLSRALGGQREQQGRPLQPQLRHHVTARLLARLAAAVERVAVAAVPASAVEAAWRLWADLALGCVDTPTPSPRVTLATHTPLLHPGSPAIATSPAATSGAAVLPLPGSAADDVAQRLVRLVLRWTEAEAACRVDASWTSASGGPGSWIQPHPPGSTSTCSLDPGSGRPGGAREGGGQQPPSPGLMRPAPPPARVGLTAVCLDGGFGAERLRAGRSAGRLWWRD